jgi:hypothetical protein
MKSYSSSELRSSVATSSTSFSSVLSSDSEAGAHVIGVQSGWQYCPQF